MIEIAQGKADAANIEDVTFEQSTIEEINVADQSLDAVLGFSILHLLESKEAVLAKVHKMLKPGGIFVSNTICLGNTMKFVRVIASIGRFLGLLPLVKVITTRELEDSLTAAGFDIDHQWESGKGIAVFIAAKRASP